LIDRKRVGELAVGGHKNHRHIRAPDLRKMIYEVHSIRSVTDRVPFGLLKKGFCYGGL